MKPLFYVLIFSIAFTGLTGCQESTQQIEFVSLATPPQETIIPGGVAYTLTLKNAGTEPVVKISAVSQSDPNNPYIGHFSYDFPDVSSYNPLLPGESCNQTLNLVGQGPVKGSQGNITLTVNATLKNGKTISEKKNLYESSSNWFETK